MEYLNQSHDDAKRLAPAAVDLEKHFAKQNRLVVAITRHDFENWRSAPEKDRFVWVICRTKTTVAELASAYLQGCGVAALEIKLSRDGVDIPLTASAGELDTYKDRVVALQAIPKSLHQTPVQPQSQPVQHSMGQSTSQSHQVRSHAGIGAMASQLPSQVSSQNWKSMTHSFQSMPIPHQQLDHGHVVDHRQQNSPSNLAKHSHEPVSTIPGVPAHSRGGNTPMSPDQHTVSPVTGFQTPRTSMSGVKSERQAHDSHISDPLEEANDIQGSQDYIPDLPQENIFQQDEPDTYLPRRQNALQLLANDENPEKLEVGVKRVLEALKQIEKPMRAKPESVDAQNWLRQIDALRETAVRTRTVVGVVGNTGSGKSSIINAMLEEERIVPTNCMRACTAVVTELSYNYDKNEAAKYRAEIEFIKPEEWEKELRVLFSEAFTEEGRPSREVSNQDSDAGVAYAKIRAVYHDMTNEQLAKSSIDGLMQVYKVNKILGSKRTIKCRDPEVFYHRLQQFVDSKEKEELDKNGRKKTNPKKKFEYWPLVKVVRIYTKADALSTGAVIVDLPGVHDSNAARAAVADKYMKQCTGLWIVAPITRAVDDKAAKNLLGESFKRQLKYDGSYSAVTFICSKTDDISRTEAIESLGIQSKVQELGDQESELESKKEKLEEKLRQLKDAKSDHASVLEDVDEQVEVWEELQEKAESGEEVYAPQSSSVKRKRSPGNGRSRKRTRITLNDSDDDDNGAQSENGDDSANESDIRDENTEPRQVITLDDIESRLKELKQLRKEARAERASIEKKSKEVHDKLKTISRELSHLDEQQTMMCIQGRNAYSAGAIKLDFANGIKELDQEYAEEKDPDNFNPDEDVRDYDKVANDLPVYCVSSRAYQKLCGRMKKDRKVHGFTTPEETGVPSLQLHCKKLTEKGRQASCRKFLNSATQLINSISLWASDDGSGLRLSSEQRSVEKNFLARKSRELQKALENCVKNVCGEVVATLNRQIFDHFDPAIEEAAVKASPTASKWGAHRNIGGLVWSTYKATVRRNGEWRSNFNEELAEPLYKIMATAWEKAFQRRLPQILGSFIKLATHLLHQFHQAAEARSREMGIGIARMGLLATQLKVHEAIFTDLATTMIGQVNEKQRDVNREFTPMIAQAMLPAYEYCTNESGSGSFARMKAGMMSHVEAVKNTMFQTAVDAIKTALQDMCRSVQKDMLDSADKVYVSMLQDYMGVFGGGSGTMQLNLSREERVLRREVDEANSKLDDMFQEILDTPMEDLQAVAGAEDPDVDDTHNSIEDISSDSGSDTTANEDDDDDDDDEDDDGVDDDERGSPNE